jgi:hypothetical protein
MTPMTPTTPMANMAKLEEIAARLPDAVRVDVEAWGGEPTFRVHGKNFVFSSHDASTIGVKLPLEEAVAVVASDSHAEPMGYGLGRHGWVSITVPKRAGVRRWREIEEWIRTSYTLVAPKKLAELVIAQDSV